MKPRILVFDLGNVLINWHQPAKNCALAARSSDPKRALALYATEYLRTFESDGDAEKFFAVFARHAGYRGGFADFKKDFCESLRFEKNGGTCDLVRAIKLKYGDEVQLWMLSNINPVHLDHLRERWPGIFSNFRRLFFSFEMGLRKPDPAIFLAMLREGGGPPPEECAFIDDIGENCETARQLGFQAHQFENVQGLKRFFAERGLAI